MQTIDKPIRNIIFDFGGVLLDIDYQLTYHAMSELLGVPDLTSGIPQEIRDVLFRFEKGQIGAESFIWYLQRLSKGEIPQGEDVIRAWNAMLIGWDVSKFRLLEELKARYNLFLLSNTNSIHINWVHRDLRLNHGITDFENRFFNKVYYSHEAGMRKPDAEIYHFVTKDSDILPEETLFIDDLPENIKAAQEAGWKVYNHNPNENLEEILRYRLKIL
jgi:epoxide hydrolase-like predicted phosphatase